MSILVDELASMVRQSIGDADATREDWDRALRQVFSNPNEQPAEEPASDTATAPATADGEFPQWHITWEIDDCDQSKTPLEAAARVWIDIFGRDNVDESDACVFLVTGPGGTQTQVDLAEYDFTSLSSALDNPHNDMPLEDYRL